MSLLGFLDTAVQLGLDGVELTAYFFPSTERSFLNNLKREAVVRGLEISGSAIGNNFCVPDAEQRREQIEMCRRWLDHSVVLGAPLMRVFAGPVPEGCSEEEARAWCIAALQEVTQYAEHKGVVLALENHGGITATAEQTLALLKAVDSPWLRANLDFGNYSRDPYHEFRLVAPYAVTTHAKVSWYEGGYGSGIRHTVDYAKVKQILDEVGYRGFISIEYEEPEDAHTGVPAFVKYLQGIFGT